MNYKAGFFIILVIFTVTTAAAAVLFDRTISNYMVLNHVAEPPEQEYAYLDPSYYSHVEIPAPLSYERNVSGVDDFGMWRTSLTNSDLSIGNNPHPEPSNVETVSPGLVKMSLGEIIVYHAPPPDKSNGRAVLIIPGSGDGSAREIMGIETRHEPYHDNIGLRLAGAGYDAYTLELDGWGERSKDVGSTCPTSTLPMNCEYFTFQEKLAKYGISLFSLHEREVATALSYVSDRHEWVAMSGLSAGALRTPAVALANADVVDAVVLASGIVMIHEWPMFVTAWRDIMVEYDMEGVDTVRALAPMPVYMSYGSLEAGSHGYAARSGDIQRAVQTAYDLHGAADKFRYVVHGGVHEYDVDSVIEFLDSS